MGIGQPTYDLEELQRLIGQGPISSSITKAAEDGATELKWTRNDIVEAVLALTSQHFYKSMASERLPSLWQDVYHLESRGIWLYIKLQMGAHGRAVVVQFKQK